MGYPFSAARTNLTSIYVRIGNSKIGEGAFRECLEGTYIGGNRNGQEAVCKRFKPQFRALEEEYFSRDFRVIEKAVEIADQWNGFCDEGEEILINKGSIHKSNSGIPYLVEPLIRCFTRFTSNGGWINHDENDRRVECMEAFSHFSYHESNGELIICDLQGRYRFDKYTGRRSRFELTDPAICSRDNCYGVTDLGWQGIESFFSNHQCNQFCQDHWSQPLYPLQYFPRTEGTFMTFH
ncbi:alpha-kinase family protein [Nitzschia inconspicua]|uniref:Alpha-kinase family protein n=1 Tax=Nitzschia inconspicua TaxID=303405 RepID=A0A9K3Q906_9STRA|nr:alpha-kinase family protein [Nitzschia inconspicua]